MLKNKRLVFATSCIILLSVAIPLITEEPEESASVVVPLSPSSETETSIDEEAFSRYKSAISLVPEINSFVDDIRINSAGNWVEIEVTPTYQKAIRSEREHFAQLLRDHWASVSDKADAEIHFADGGGSEVGRASEISTYVDP